MLAMQLETAAHEGGAPASILSHPAPHLHQRAPGRSGCIGRHRDGGGVGAQAQAVQDAAQAVWGQLGETLHWEAGQAIGDGRPAGSSQGASGIVGKANL